MISHKQNSAMKTLSRIFLTAILFAITLVSCGKITPTGGDTPGGDIPGGNTEQEAGTRIITLSFNTKATRTELGEDYTPKFSDGDMIAISSISNPTDTQHCKVSVDPSTGIATTETGFSGKCNAVYPAKYARFVNGQLTYFVPSEQTGEFEDANICTAEISEGNNPVAEFQNQTAVFVIELENLYSYDEYPNYGIGVNEVTISSLGKIENGQRGTTKSPISSDTESEYEIIIPEGAKYYRCPLYISVLCDAEDPVLLADLNFDINYDFYADWDNDYDPTTSPTSMGGFSPKFLGYLSGETVRTGAIYTGVEDHLHEYECNNYYNPNTGINKTYSWAKEDLETSGGDFFMFGELDGHRYVNGSWTNFGEKANLGFAIGNMRALSTTYSEGDVLRLEDDAAYYNWGGAWRMPTSDEIKKFSGGASTNPVINTLTNYSYVMGANNPQPVEYSGSHYYWTSEYGGVTQDEGSIIPQGRAFYYDYSTPGGGDYYVRVPDASPEALPRFYGIRIRPISGIITEENVL